MSHRRLGDAEKTTDYHRRALKQWKAEAAILLRLEDLAAEAEQVFGAKPQK
jgi:hypothetical protein